MPTPIDSVEAIHHLVEEALAAPSKEVTFEAARAFLHWARDPLGVDPGDFVKRLLPAVFAADKENLELLRVGFPGLVAAVEMYRHKQDWIGILRGIVRDGVAK